jgi:hypothetical protein
MRRPPGHALALAGIVALAAWLIATGLSWGIPGSALAELYYQDPAAAYQADPHSLALHSLHPDEPHVFMALNNMQPSALDFNPRYFMYPTLYIYAVGAALQASALAGVTTLIPDKPYYFEHPDAVGTMYLVARSTTTLFGLLTLGACYALGRRLYGRDVGLLAALLLAVMPFFAVHSKLVTVDVPVTFWTTLTLLLAHRALGTPRLRWWAATGLAAGLAAGTKYYGGIVILALLAPAWLASRSAHRPADTAPAPGRHPVLTAVALVPVGFLLGCPYALLDPGSFFGGLYDIYDAQSGGQESYDMEYGYFPWPWLMHLYMSLPQGMGPPLLLLAALGVAWAVRRRALPDRVLLAFVIPFLLLVSVSLLRPMRYVIPLLPPLAVLGARLVIDVGAAIRRARGPIAARAAVTAIVVAATGYSLLASIAVSRQMARPDARQVAARLLQRRAEPGSRVGVFSIPTTFRTPPVDGRRYRLVELGLNRDRYVAELPDHVLLSELEYHDIRRLRARVPREAALADELLSGTFTAGGVRYAVEKIERHPTLFGWDFRPSRLIHDGLFVSPDVYLLTRQPLGARSGA